MRWETRQAYAEWIRQLPWEWFVTLTLPEGSTMASLERLHAKWSGELHQQCKRQLRQVMADERQRNGTPHYHGLAFGVELGGPWQLEKKWQGWCVRDPEILWYKLSGGMARIRVYEPRAGAEEYCTKYILKDDAGDVRLIGPWPHRSPELPL